MSNIPELAKGQPSLTWDSVVRTTFYSVGTTSPSLMHAAATRGSQGKVPFDNVDYPPIPKELVVHVLNSATGRAQSPWAYDESVLRRELAQLLGFLLESEISAFRSVWQVAQWLALNLKPEKNGSVAFCFFEPEHLVVPFVNSLRRRGFLPRLVPLTDSYDVRLDILPQLAKAGPLFFILSVVEPITGRITNASDVVKAVHEVGGLVAVDATHYVQRLSQSLGTIDSDLTLIRSRPLLAPDGIVLTYMSRRLRETLKRDPEASSSWHSMSSLDAPVESVRPMVESIRYLAGLSGRRKAEAENSKAILEGLRQCDSVRIIGPADVGERVAIFTLSVGGLEPAEVALLLDSGTDLLVSSGKPGMGSSQLLHSYPDNGAIRASPFVNNGANDVERFVEAMKSIDATARWAGPVTS